MKLPTQRIWSRISKRKFMQSEAMYTLSLHARQRLAERSKVNADELLHHLNAGAFKRIFREMIRSVSTEEISKLKNEFGFTDSEIKGLKIVRCIPTYDYLLIWFNADESPLIAVVACSPCLVVTLLHADLVSKKRLQVHLTPKAFSLARQRTEHLHQLKNKKSTYEIVFRWLDADSRPRTRVRSAASILNDQPLTLARPIINLKAKEIAIGGYGISAAIRLKNNPNVIIQEFEFDYEPSTA